MFSLKGLLQDLGISLVFTIGFPFIFGLFNIGNVESHIIFNFLLSYISVGVLAPFWNRKTQYFAAFIGSVTLTVMNFTFSIFVLNIPVFTDPIDVNNNLTLSTVTSLLTAYVFLKIQERKQRESHVQGKL